MLSPLPVKTVITVKESKCQNTMQWMACLAVRVQVGLFNLLTTYACRASHLAVILVRPSHHMKLRTHISFLRLV